MRDRRSWRAAASCNLVISVSRFESCIPHVNTKQKGSLGVARAILYYTENGYAVFVPVSDVSRYDIIVDDGSGPVRVEVKTTSNRNGEVTLRTCGGNRSWSGVVKRISTVDCDVVFCYNTLTKVFKIFSSEDLEGRSTVRVR